MVRRFLVTVCVGLGLGGCGQILGVSDWVVDHDGGADHDGGGDYDGGGDVHVSADAGGDAAATCASPKPGGLAGVLVQHEFCIDTTETPVALYDKFVLDLATDPAKGQPPECRWNTSYVPSFDPFQNDPNRATRPISYVDWCDAAAFCKYWGKHLCGARGDGGVLPLDAVQKTDQWYTACTNGTAQTYPYGQLFDASACNANVPHDEGGLLPVGTPASCQGGVAGLFDMSGNAQEWENACASGSPDAGDDTCQLRGGTFFFESDSVECGSLGGGHRDTRNSVSPWNTIRCCWEP